MRLNPHRTLGARLVIFVVLNCCTPLPASSAMHADSQWRTARGEKPGRHDLAALRLSRNSLPGRPQRVNASEPPLVRVRACVLALMQDGCDGQLPDYWLEALGEDTIIEGLPGDLVVAFYGQPLEREAVTFEGSPAELWSIGRHAGQAQRVIIMSGKIVHVGA
jgi:hypothetical protein